MITAFAPGSVGNVSCGFDVLGMAIHQPGDEVSVSFNEIGEVRIVKITGDGGKLPTEASKNTGGVAVISLLKHLGEKRGIDIEIHKKMPLGSGLGSSAASAVAGVVAANALLDNPLTRRDLLPFAMDGEAIATGAYHADNVAPSLLGGIVLIRSYEPLEIIELPVPSHLYYAVIHPDVKILTKDARAVMPKEVPMQTAVTQMGQLAGFVAGLYQNDLPLIGRSMTDILAEPYRSTLIPAFKQVKNAAMYGGALSFGISGSGPSMFAFADSLVRAKQIAVLMQKALIHKQIASEVYTGRVNVKGAVVI